MSASAVIQPEVWPNGLNLDAVFAHPSHPLEVDLGCGKGRFIVARARRFPETNYIGIDRQLGRIRKTDKKTQGENLDNLRLLRLEITYAVERILPPASAATVYLFFPDPWPKRRHHPRRLVNARFIAALNRCLLPGGQIHIATDHAGYAEVMRGEFSQSAAFEVTEPFIPSEDEATEFETIFTARSQPVHRRSFRTLQDPAHRGSPETHAPLSHTHP